MSGGHIFVDNSDFRLPFIHLPETPPPPANRPAQ